MIKDHSSAGNVTSGAHGHGLAERTSCFRSKSNISGAAPHWLASAWPAGQLPVVPPGLPPGLPPGGPEGGPDGGPDGGATVGGPPEGGGEGGPLGGLGGPLGGLLLPSTEANTKTNVTTQSFIVECPPM